MTSCHGVLEQVFEFFDSPLLSLLANLIDVHLRLRALRLRLPYSFRIGRTSWEVFRSPPSVSPDEIGIPLQGLWSDCTGDLRRGRCILAGPSLWYVAPDPNRIRWGLLRSWTVTGQSDECPFTDQTFLQRWTQLLNQGSAAGCTNVCRHWGSVALAVAE